MLLKEKIKGISKEIYEEVVGWRRHLHANPELSFEEFETADFVAQKLKSIGIEFQRGIAKTGIVALIKGNNPEKKTVALRADMDALPILEQNDIPYKSKNEGKMHACGHDVHTSSLLGTALILSEIKAEFEGAVKLIFQPSEEVIPGGAKVMIEEGVLKNPAPDSIFGQHVYPQLSAGQVGFRAGQYMASADEVHLKINGKGGHAAMPHYNIDPVLITSHIIVALQQLVSRNSDPLVPTVLSFGKVIANGATNIIPGEVMVEGTLRTMNESWRQEMKIKIKEMAQGLAESLGGSCEVKIVHGYPFLVNDDKLTARTKLLAQEYMGAENVLDLPMRMGAEDFAYFSQEMPACFYRLGTGNIANGITSGLHTSTFDIDEDALVTGPGLMCWLAINELKE